MIGSGGLVGDAGDRPLLQPCCQSFVASGGIGELAGLASRPGMALEMSMPMVCGRDWRNFSVVLCLSSGAEPLVSVQA